MKDYYYSIVIEKMVSRRVGLLTIILKFGSNFLNLTELFLKLIQFTHLILIRCTQVFLMHDKLKLCISSIIKDSFKSSKKAFIRVTPKSAAFSDSARKYKGTYILDENEVIEMYNYMIDSCYIEFKGKVYRQHV